MNLDVRVLTPNRVICSTIAQEVILPGLTGLVGVLEGHATLITALDIGILRIKSDQTWTPIILCGGVAEIDRDRVTVLVNDVEDLISPELTELNKQLEQAISALELAQTSKERLDASDELKRATARVEAANLLS